MLIEVKAEHADAAVLKFEGASILDVSDDDLDFVLRHRGMTAAARRAIESELLRRHPKRRRPRRRETMPETFREKTGTY